MRLRARRGGSCRPIDQIAKPFSPGNAFPAEEVARERLTFHKAMIGSCTNGGYDDLLHAALVLRAAIEKGVNRVAKDVDFVVFPGSGRVKRDIEHADPRLGGRSIADVFRAVGGKIRESWCGPCFGQGPDSLAPGERAITSFNRNWQNRMGVGGEGISASPAVVASLGPRPATWRRRRNSGSHGTRSDSEFRPGDRPAAPALDLDPSPRGRILPLRARRSDCLTSPSNDTFISFRFAENGPAGLGPCSTEASASRATPISLGPAARPYGEGGESRAWGELNLLVAAKLVGLSGIRYASCPVVVRPLAIEERRRSRASPVAAPGGRRPGQQLHVLHVDHVGDGNSALRVPGHFGRVHPAQGPATLR